MDWNTFNKVVYEPCTNKPPINVGRDHVMGHGKMDNDYDWRSTNTVFVAEFDCYKSKTYFIHPFWFKQNKHSWTGTIIDFNKKYTLPYLTIQDIYYYGIKELKQFCKDYDIPITKLYKMNGNNKGQYVRYIIIYIELNYQT